MDILLQNPAVHVYTPCDLHSFLIERLSTDISYWANRTYAPAIALTKDHMIERHYSSDPQPRHVLYHRLRKVLEDVRNYRGAAFVVLGPSIVASKYVRDLSAAIEVLDQSSKLFPSKRAAELAKLRLAFTSALCFVDNADAMNAEVNTIARAIHSTKDRLDSVGQVYVGVKMSASRIAALDFTPCQQTPQLLADLNERRQVALRAYDSLEAESLQTLVRIILTRLGIDLARGRSIEGAVFHWRTEQISNWSWYKNGWTISKLQAKQQQLRLECALFGVVDPALSDLAEAYEASIAEVKAFSDLTSVGNRFYYGLLDKILEAGTCTDVKSEIRCHLNTLPWDERSYIETRLCVWDGGHDELLNLELKQLLQFRHSLAWLSCSDQPLVAVSDIVNQLARNRANPEIAAIMEDVRSALVKYSTQLQSLAHLFKSKAVVSHWTNPELANCCTKTYQEYLGDWKAQDEAAIRLLTIPERVDAPDFSFTCDNYTVRVHRDVLERKRGPLPDYFHGLVGFAQKDYHFPKWERGVATLHMSPVLLQATIFFLYTGRIPDQVWNVYRHQLCALFEKLLLAPPR